MPLHAFLVIVAFVLLGVSVYLIGKKSNISVSEVRGKPTIEPFFFYSGKIALFCSVLMFLIKALIPHFGYVHIPATLAWIATVVLWLSATFMAIALKDLGSEVRMGLPKSVNHLPTRGMFRFSRNPLYVSLDMMVVASCLYFPDLINITLALYGIIVHHFIIKGEEEYLSRQFKNEWEQYTLKVRRYL